MLREYFSESKHYNNNNNKNECWHFVVWFDSSLRFIGTIFFFFVLGWFVASFVRPFSTRKRALRKSTHGKGAHANYNVKSGDEEEEKKIKRKKDKTITSGTNSVAARILKFWCAINLHICRFGIWHHANNSHFFSPGQHSKKVETYFFRLLFSSFSTVLWYSCA